MGVRVDIIIIIHALNGCKCNKKNYIKYKKVQKS